MEPASASLKDLYLVHSIDHIEVVKLGSPDQIAALATGGAICAAELAIQGEPASRWCARPGTTPQPTGPGGLCYFNSMAIAVKNIRPRAKKALIIDIDLHYEDGTVSIFQGDHNMKIVNPWSVDENFEYLDMDESRYLSQVEDAFLNFDYDIVGVSAGFDTYLEDWGGLLKREDYGKYRQSHTGGGGEVQRAQVRSAGRGVSYGSEIVHKELPGGI